jgi:hypothetical protein
MAAQLTPVQKRHLEGIVAKVQYYLDVRYVMARRFNPNLERAWEDLAAQQLNTLRITLSAEKMFGPIRYNVAELLVSDDAKKRQELFLRKSQNCLMSEIVEGKEGDGHKTHGAMEIHDLRTLCSAIDPALEKVVVLIQTFIWWDLEDAVDWLRFENKLKLQKRIQEGGFSEELAAYYREMMQADHVPSQAEALAFETKMMRSIVEGLRQRRQVEAGYQLVLRREQSAAEQPEVLIEALAGQQNILKALKAGTALPQPVVEQIAKAMGVTAAEATADRIQPFIEQTLVQNRRRLKDALAGTGSGALVNVKQQQFSEFESQVAALEGAAG